MAVNVLNWTNNFNLATCNNKVLLA